MQIFNVHLNYNDLACVYKPVSTLYKNDISTILKKYVINGKLDANGLKDEYFSTFNADVFISHSHDDKALAEKFASFLQNEFGLKCFLDSQVWGSADELIKLLDKDVRANNDGELFEKDMMLTTGHVHSMLMTSIFTAIKKARVVFFINTHNSIPNQSDISSKTYSPWIYSEIVFARGLMEGEKKTMMFSESVNQSFVFEYKLPLEGLPTMEFSDIKEWKQLYSKNKNEDALASLKTLCKKSIL